MKTLTNRTLYRCDHCPKTHLTRKAMLRHEAGCKSNPNNRHACFTCVHLVRTTEEAAVDAQGKLVTAKRTVFTCAALGKDLYSYVAERKNMLDYVGDAERMPLQCSAHAFDNPYPDAPFASPESTPTTDSPF